MKLSRHFRLDVTQHELDFVDIDLDNDTPLFIDPHILGIRIDSWSHDASRTVRNFFQYFLTLVRQGRQPEALELFLKLGEPNETRLGLSKARSQGRGVGPHDALELFNSLVQSRAVATGLVEHIEDCRLFVPGIDRDKTSDMTTNVIRRHLVEYTQKQCRLWKIPLTSNVPSGMLWDRAARRWEERHTEMLVVGVRKLLLVPKSVVAFSLAYTPQRYHQHFVLNFLQAHHLSIRSALVKQRRPKKGRPGERYVTKKSIVEHEARLTKDYLTTFTQSHPEVFAQFKSAQANTEPLETTELAQEPLHTVIDRLISELQSVPPGNENASRYHKTITAAFELIFYPRLTSPDVEVEINQGRKRIDLTFDNAATDGFFQKLHTTYNTPAQFIKVECKNYSRDIQNPELDQMIGRFSPNHGKFGMIVCRDLADEGLFAQRCADAYAQQQGIILHLVDRDVVAMLTELRNGQMRPGEMLLQEKYRAIAM